MRRREFIAGLGSAAAWPVVARAQQAAMPVIGYLGAQSAGDDYENYTVPFLQGLKETGYVCLQGLARGGDVRPVLLRGPYTFF
jgi:putative ABC transport system substrate-binding protein